MAKQGATPHHPCPPNGPALTHRLQFRVTQASLPLEHFPTANGADPQHTSRVLLLCCYIFIIFHVQDGKKQANVDKGVEKHARQSWAFVYAFTSPTFKFPFWRLINYTAKLLMKIQAGLDNFLTTALTSEPLRL